MMVWLLHFNLPEIFLKLFASFLWVSFQLTLSNLQASFKISPSLLEVSYEFIVVEASFELASSSFELRSSGVLLMSFLQARISLSFKLPLSLLQAFL